MMERTQENNNRCSGSNRIKFKIKNFKSHQLMTFLISSPANIGNLMTKFQSLGILLHGFQLHALGSWFCLLRHHSFLMKGSTCLQLSNLSACFLPIAFWKSNGLFSFYTRFVPFIPSWQCFCRNRFLKNLQVFCEFHWYSLHQKKDVSSDLSKITLSLFKAHAKMA